MTTPTPQEAETVMLLADGFSAEFRDNGSVAILHERGGLHMAQSSELAMVHEIKRLRALAAAEQAEPTLTYRLQSRCIQWGAYWRAPDGHGVNITVEQATELLRDALGVEVEIAAPKATPCP